jgi:hypothetical protein
VPSRSRARSRPTSSGRNPRRSIAATRTVNHIGPVHNTRLSRFGPLRDLPGYPPCGSRFRGRVPVLRDEKLRLRFQAEKRLNPGGPLTITCSEQLPGCPEWEIRPTEIPASFTLSRRCRIALTAQYPSRPATVLPEAADDNEVVRFRVGESFRGSGAEWDPMEQSIRHVFDRCNTKMRYIEQDAMLLPGELVPCEGPLPERERRCGDRYRSAHLWRDRPRRVRGTGECATICGSTGRSTKPSDSGCGPEQHRLVSFGVNLTNTSASSHVFMTFPSFRSCGGCARLTFRGAGQR